MFLNRRDFLSGVAASALAPLKGQTGAYTLDPDTFGKTLKAPDGGVVFTYLTQKPDNIPLAGNSACCLHPINTPSGVRVTDIAPPDHRDHRGLYFAWQSVDFHRKQGVIKGDFWGWGHNAPTEDRMIRNRDVRLVKTSAQAAEVLVNNDWMVKGEKMMGESTTIHVTRDRAATVLDLTYRFGSDGDVTINQVAFTGFAFRARKDGKSWYYSDPKGKVTLPDSKSLVLEANWPAADWYSYTIALDNGKTIAIAVVDHPGNPPSTWHESQRLTYLNPCISALQPVTIPAGKTLTLRYRALAHDGAFPPGVMNEFAAAFRNG